MKRFAGAVVLSALFTCSASAAGPVHVSLSGKRPAPVAGRAWTVRLAVRPAAYAGAIQVTASGARRVHVRAAGRRGSYRARLVFPTAGLWRLTARAGGTTSRLGFLALLGATAARAGGSPVWRSVARVTFWGALAMALTAGVGALFGATL